MENTKIIYVDFQKGCKDNIEYIQLDPVLLKVRDELDEQDFRIYKQIVDDWMNRCFAYQMEEQGGKLYNE